MRVLFVNRKFVKFRVAGAAHISLAANADHSQQFAALPNSSVRHTLNRDDVLQIGRPLYIFVPEQNIIRVVFSQVAELSTDRCWQAKCFLPSHDLECAFMPQLRQDRFTKEWVFVATESAEGPPAFAANRVHKSLAAFDPNCPICPGNEHRTAPEVLRVPAPGKCGWTVRVVPSQCDVANVDKGLVATNCAPHEAGGFVIRETVVETPDHSLSTGNLPEAQLARVWRASKGRFDELSLDSRIGHATIVKNHGVMSGASLEHSHSQVIATQIIPSHVSSWLQQGQDHYRKCQECIFCRMVQDELDAQTRIVTTTEHFVALEPFASPTPFCTHVYPRRHMANFGETNADEINDLARILHFTLGKIHFGLDDPDLTYRLRTAPAANTGIQYYHWHLSIVPYLPPAFGIRKADRVLMNSVSPERAAEYLKSVRLEEAIPA